MPGKNQKRYRGFCSGGRYPVSCHFQVQKKDRSWDVSSENVEEKAESPASDPDHL